MSLKKFTGRAVAFLFPPRCPACRDVSGSVHTGELCPACSREFEKNFARICPNCGADTEKCACIRTFEPKRGRKTNVRRTVVFGHYRGFRENDVTSSLIYGLKRDRDISHAEFFARSLSHDLMKAILTAGDDPKDYVITYVPRTKKAVFTYGFDHMKITAKRLSKTMGIPHVSVMRNKGTKVQKTMNAAERAKNARASLSLTAKAKEKIAGKKVILADDVITSGSTMQAAVNLLCDAGAAVIIPCAMLYTAKTNI